MRETSKVFNRIPWLALVNNRTRQNADRISLQKQTSNDKIYSNLLKLGITMLFVSEKVLLFDPKSFRRQKYSSRGCPLKNVWGKFRSCTDFPKFSVRVNNSFPCTNITFVLINFIFFFFFFYETRSPSNCSICLLWPLWLSYKYQALPNPYFPICKADYFIYLRMTLFKYF